MSVVSGSLPAGTRRTSYAGLAAVETRAPAERGTVLLVPGYTGSKEDLVPLLPLLAEAGWRAVAVDQRGQFESPGSDDPADYAVDALGADLLAVVDALGAPVHLVGHSFGGLVSRAAVLARPDAARSLVLLGSGPAALGGQRAALMAHVRPLLETGGLEAVHEAQAAIAAADPRRAPQPPEVQEFLRRRFVSGSRTALEAMGEALLSEPDRVDALAATVVPVLVAHGEGDDAWLPEAQHAMAVRLGAAYEVVPGSIHSPAVENPEATAKALLAFWG